MTPTLKRIVTAEMQLLHLYTSGDYDREKIARLRQALRELWPRRRAELAGASEAMRQYAEETMRTNKQAAGADVRWK